MSARTLGSALLLGGLVVLASPNAPGGGTVRVVSVGALLPGVGTDHVTREPAATVTMTNQLTFEDDTVNVSVGETVVWRNNSDLVHTVTADPARAAKEGSANLPSGAKPFDSGRLAPGATFSHAFRVVGTYGYFCVPHEAASMTGTVIVSDRLNTGSRHP